MGRHGSVLLECPAARPRVARRVPHIRESFRLADGRVVEIEIGHAFIKVGDRAEITLVLFGEPESPTLLGASSLEGLRLNVDASAQRLVPMPWLPLFELLPA